MDEALELSASKKGDDYIYDFIGEIARDLKQYKEIFTYLSDKFKALESVHNKIKSNCEANCFYNGKKNNIVPSLAIMNLKSNHKWTDRAEHTLEGGDKPIQAIISLGNGTKPKE
jgi:hypothetical protein